MSAHGYDKKVFPLTAAQGRVLYHLERLFRSTGHGIREHARYLQACEDVGLPLRAVHVWSVSDCIMGLQLMEQCARPMRLFRHIATNWEDFA